ncbi:MAG: hypothetical protein AABX34_03125 [Nanoarchaeota archaeon]
MARLLSDIEGKIRHILISSRYNMEIPRIKHIVNAFDADVTITIFYQKIPEDNALAEFSHLEQLIASLPHERNINYVPITNQPWLWIQDLIHVREDHSITPSRPSEPLLSKDGKETQQNIASIIDSAFWEDKGFPIKPNTTGLYNTDCGDIIVFNNNVFVGSYIINKHLKYNARYNANFQTGDASSYSYQYAKEEYMAGLRKLDSERNLHIMDVGGEPLAHHLNMVFTPIDENTVAVADPKSTLEYLNLPKEIQPVPSHQRLVNQLERFAESLERKYNRVVRIPLIPRLYRSNENKAQSYRREGKFTISSQELCILMSFNAVLQERYSLDGNTVHKIYIPTHSVPDIINANGIDLSRFGEVQQQAISTYESLGIQVKPVSFNYMVGFDGGLACTIKVLERG